MARSVRVLIGTRKGGFIYTSDERRECWEISEPILPGWSFYHMSADTRRETPRLYAAANHWAWGPMVVRSDDFGKTWQQGSPGLAFPQDMGISAANVWNVTPGHAFEPGVVYAGTQPAGLFRSEDWGESWAPVETLNRHPYREYWGGSGGGDSALHSIEVDPRSPEHVYVSVATGGSYVTADGGKTWSLCSHRAIATNEMSKKMFEEFFKKFPQFADFGPPTPPNVDPAAVNEMHKMRLDPTKPDRIWAQTHVGVFRSDDGGEYWHDVTAGLPSFHGFPIGVSRNGDGAAYVVPLAFEDDNFRVCRGQFTVYRTRDGGCSWQALTCGLPGPNDYQSVYREGVDTDGLEQEGVYVGTSNGQVYASADGGDHWQRLPGTLPPVLSVSCLVS